MKHVPVQNAEQATLWCVHPTAELLVTNPDS